jgi:hypothetical protein
VGGGRREGGRTKCGREAVKSDQEGGWRGRAALIDGRGQREKATEKKRRRGTGKGRQGRRRRRRRRRRRERRR